MARATVIANQKGGVSKTTTSHALSAGLTTKNYSVLAIDLDPQGSLSTIMRADTNAKGVFEAMSGEPIAELVQETADGHILTSSTQLTGADKKFSDYGAEYLLKDALEPVKEKYQFIIIDSPPQLSILTVNALICATDLIIPLTCDLFAIMGLSQLLDTVGRIQKRGNPDLIIAGLLLTRYTHRAILNRDLKQSIETKASDLGTKLYSTIIREGVAIREAQTGRQSIFRHAPQSNAAIDYEDFINEYLK